MTTLLLIRHGETEWNTENRVQGHTNSPLSSRGLRQAQALSLRLQKYSISAIYSSDLERAVTTIQPYADMAGLKIHKTPALREKNFGEWEGLIPAEISERYPELWRRYHEQNDIHVQIPGGETWAEVCERTVGFMQKVISQHDQNETIILVGHGGALRPMILHALSAPIETILHFSTGNTGITTLKYNDPNHGRIIHLNDMCHLEHHDDLI